MDKCNEKRLKHDIEHLSSVVNPCDTADQETITDSASLNLMNTLGINVKPFGLSSSSWLNKNWRWQKRTKPPEKSTTNKFKESTFNDTTRTTSIMMRSPNPLKPNSKKINSCSTGSKRRTIYGGTLASTFSVFLIKCLIVATAYDDKFVNKL